MNNNHTLGVFKAYLLKLIKSAIPLPTRSEVDGWVYDELRRVEDVETRDLLEDFLTETNFLSRGNHD